MTAQLVAAQQRVAELTPLAEEADSLQSRVADACRHADEAKRAFEALLSRAWRDNEEAANVKKEQDKLPQKDAETCQRILDLVILFHSVLLFWCIPTLPFIKTVELEV